MSTVPALLIRWWLQTSFFNFACRRAALHGDWAGLPEIYKKP